MANSWTTLFRARWPMAILCGSSVARASRKARAKSAGSLVRASQPFRFSSTISGQAPVAWPPPDDRSPWLQDRSPQNPRCATGSTTKSTARYHRGISSEIVCWHETMLKRTRFSSPADSNDNSTGGLKPVSSYLPDEMRPDPDAAAVLQSKPLSSPPEHFLGADNTRRYQIPRALGRERTRHSSSRLWADDRPTHPRRDTPAGRTRQVKSRPRNRLGAIMHSKGAPVRQARVSHMCPGLRGRSPLSTRKRRHTGAMSGSGTKPTSNSRDYAARARCARQAAQRPQGKAER